MAVMNREAGRLSRMLYGFFETSVVVAVTRLGLPDLLGKPHTLIELTETLGAHEDSLRRLLRAALHLGLVAVQDNHFTLTERGDYLRVDAPNSIRNLVLMFGASAPLRAWAELDHTVRTGQTAFEHVHGMTA